MTLTTLSSRRSGATVKVRWGDTGGPDHVLLATFGYDLDRRVREVFVASFRAEGGIVAMANDACIFLSRCLQHGDAIAELAVACVENRGEGQPSGPPASMIGAIARAGVEVQRWLDGRDEDRIWPRLVVIDELDHPAGGGLPVGASPPPAES